MGLQNSDTFKKQRLRTALQNVRSFRMAFPNGVITFISLTQRLNIAFLNVPHFIAAFKNSGPEYKACVGKTSSQVLNIMVIAY